MTINKSKNGNKDYSISCARFVAMCFIFACHVMQRDDFSSNINDAHISWAFWFNVGVQMFLFISGLLYGKRDEIDVFEFYKKGFAKILVDYYVFIIVMIMVILWSPLMSIDKYDVVGLITLSGTIQGLEHLWFISTILLCYLFVPVFSAIINVIYKHGNVRFFVESILLVLVVHVVVKCFFAAFSSAWINCFVIGMLYSRIERRKIVKNIFCILTLIACLVIIPVQFRIDYWQQGEIIGPFSLIYSNLVQYGHVFLGIVLVIVIRLIYNRCESKTFKHDMLNWSDNHSYDVYLVHHVFVQSSFGCVEFISNRWIAIPLAIVLTVVTSMFLHVVSEFIRNKVFSSDQKFSNPC